MNLKVGAWILGFIALAAFITVVLANGLTAVRWVAFGVATCAGFLSLGMVVNLALGWDETTGTKTETHKYYLVPRRSARIKPCRMPSRFDPPPSTMRRQ